MKLVTFCDTGVRKIGILEGEKVYHLAGSGWPLSMKGLIEASPAILDEFKRQKTTGSLFSSPLNSVQILAPLYDPQKIIAIGHNYMDHIREQNAAVPTRPMVFAKFPSTIIGPGDSITWDPAITTQVDIEVELGIVIGRPRPQGSP